MKLRSFATLLVCAALAACGGDTLLPTQELAGRWVTGTATWHPILPDGTRPMLARVELTLRRSGEYREEFRLWDPVAGIDFPDAVTEGTYSAAEGVIHLTRLRSYNRAGGAPTSSITLQPVQPSTTESRPYVITGEQLAWAGPGCGPLANCVPNPFGVFTRVDVE